MWGLGDDHVFVWGPWGNYDRIFRWDGRSWHPMPSPGPVVAMHGTRHDLVFAVGADGLVAWWAGGQWFRLAYPRESLLNGVFVRDESTVWICSFRGRIIEASICGCVDVTFSGVPTYEIVERDGRVIVPSERDGLLELVRDRLEPMDPVVEPKRLESRDRMVVVSEKLIADVEDEELVRTVELAAFMERLRSRDPMWQPTGLDQP